MSKHAGPPSQEAPGESPGTRLLDALRVGDDAGVVALCSETTTVSAENMSWSCRGRDEIEEMLTRVRERFPGLTFDSSTRHVGFGLVIDEARVQDEAFQEPVEDEDDEAARPSEPVADPSVHPMWDEPATEERNVLSVWRHRADRPARPTRLNMPVRVTVRHDDLQVHEVTLSFPAALLKGALGQHVDPFEMSLSEVQSAFIAPVGAGFETFQLAPPTLSLAAPPAAEPAERWEPDEEPSRRRRGRILVPLLILLIAALGGGAWYATQGSGGTATAGDHLGGTSSTPPSPSPSQSPSASATTTSSKVPTVTHESPGTAPSHTPNITLKSDLAFGFNSASLSPQARARIDLVAKQVREAGLTGKIYVDGYTDNLGSAAYGLTLSQRRADAVSHYLGSQLVGVPVTIVSIGHGEADPIASNATQAGRQANRRVTITLPKP